MHRMMLNAKIHNATVTEANLNYVGSITIDEDILDAVNMLPNEKVQVVNNNNGDRFETYIIAGERGGGTICLNGAAARLVQVGDIIIVMSYVMIHENKLDTFKPRIAIMDGQNKIQQLIGEELERTIY
ncbi:aspartate 1-decarboxylase [Paenibacillus pabuli]|uniref:aspartate 1-decarboxylase n=1 Tax=Paenibacillus pabuli TaxID=1472 RepID=UPI003CFA5AD3